MINRIFLKNIVTTVAGVLIAGTVLADSGFQFHQRVAGLQKGGGKPAQVSGTSCTSIKQENPSTPSGIYTIVVDGELSINGYCDMQTDGGGWLLVMNYLRSAGTSAAVSVLDVRLPLLQGLDLGVDESQSTDHWGHAAPTLFAKLNPSEARFLCKTSNHNRTVHFKSNDQAMIEYFSTGIGSINIDNFRESAVILDGGENSGIPKNTDNARSSEGNLAMTEFPFYKFGTGAWGVAGGSGGNRWECDDRATTAPDTLHQVWIRQGP